MKYGETGTVPPFSVRPGGAGGFQQSERSDQIGLHEGRRARDGTVHMAFGGEVDDGIDEVFAQQPIHQRSITDVALNKGMPGRVGEIAQIVRRAGIGQQVEIDNVDIGVGRQQVADEIAADEAGAAGHQHVAGTMFHDSLGLVGIGVEFGDHGRVIGWAFQPARGFVHPTGGADRRQRRADENVIDA